ncbi:MAG: Ribosomal RNA large subunit methyltransferase H [Candidatus Omnitrophica bacterium]|nr:Ribosomal RNA large subunit methyltransferase H [Candidatus Omnitrophota bacterium]
MRIRLALGWVPSEGEVRASAFKTPAPGWIETYLTRLRAEHAVEITGLSGTYRKKPRTHLWLCDRKDGVSASSEEVARRLDRALRSGATELVIAVGPADGWSASDRVRLGPDWTWSFGGLTLPHELAALVAAEQTYRAWSILKGKPYHEAHR